MNPDIERLAKEVGLTLRYDAARPDEWMGTTAQLAKFAALMAEECAKVCDTTPPQPFRPSIEAAHAIRAKFPKPK